ncbi:hypothetical protein [Streptomyces bacillaris]|uniref:hypothetical protein n=1 Tax=Streptomyces bacillaris TaxID=68179 RepID=UPI003D75C40A
MTATPQQNVSARAEQALREAMDRLLAGKPLRTDGKLTKNNLWREAGVSRATMNRASAVLADWDSRVTGSPASQRDQKQTQEITALRRHLKENKEARQRLQDQVDASATVIMALLSENASLREQLVNRSAVVVTLPRSQAVRE